MEEALRETLLILAAAIKEDPRLLALDEIDSRLSKSEEVAELSEKAKEKVVDYAYNRDHFGEASELTKASQHEAYLAKKALDEHPLSKEYQAKYRPVRELYAEIDYIILSPYRDKPRCGKGSK